MFVIFSAFTFFGWGEIYSLFPALCETSSVASMPPRTTVPLHCEGDSSVFVPIGSALPQARLSTSVPTSCSC